MPGTDVARDLAKIDVEGYELNLLRGMARSVANAPHIKILFKKLWVNSGIEPGTIAFFSQLGFDLYAVHQDASLAPIAGERELPSWPGCRLHQLW